MELETMGWISLIPAIIAIVLSFATKNTIVALIAACLVGTLAAGQGILGLPTLIKEATGNTSFSWVMLLNLYIAIIVAFFHKTGAIQGFSDWVHRKNMKRKGVQLMAWFLGIFVYFSDSFSPLFVGTVMRDISDKARISKEKLSYIADSTAAPVSVLVPITGWAAYLMGLAVGIGSIVTQDDASALFVKAIPFNFYPLFAVIMVGLVASGIVKDFGPMKKAELRAINEGKVLRDGATPLIGKELLEMEVAEGIKTRVFLNFVLPVLLIISIIWLCIGWLPFCGLKVLKPQEALVLTLFGKYVGTLKDDGFYFVNPFCTSVNPAAKTKLNQSGDVDGGAQKAFAVTVKNEISVGEASSKKISLKIMTLNNNRQKINDCLGNPVEIGIAVMWRVTDTAKAVFNVDNYKEYLSLQCDSALRNIVRIYPYDVAPNVDTTGDGVADEGSLRGSSEVVASRIRDEIQQKVADAGLEVIEARITYLAYAQEIAAVMLQRQQASAIIDARKMIVDGAVGMVEMALNQLSENNVVELDEERKAAMVSNLLVVLCGNKDAQPIVNSGSIY